MSDVSAVDYSSYVTSDYTLPSVSNKSLDGGDFYTLLLAEIANQDPTEPMDSKDMILQLAQFSSIENTQTLTENMSDWVDKSSMTTAASLIGNDVVYLDSESSTYYAGTVSGVTKDGDGYNVLVDGFEVPLSNVVEVYTGGTVNSTDSKSDTSSEA